MSEKRRKAHVVLTLQQRAEIFKLVDQKVSKRCWPVIFNLRRKYLNLPFIDTKKSHRRKVWPVALCRGHDADEAQNLWSWTQPGNESKAKNDQNVAKNGRAEQKSCRNRRQVQHKGNSCQRCATSRSFFNLIPKFDCHNFTKFQNFHFYSSVSLAPP